MERNWIETDADREDGGAAQEALLEAEGRDRPRGCGLGEERRAVGVTF